MSTTSPLTFGALLRRLRLAAGLTQEALAERAGLSARGVQNLERGVNVSPRADTLQLLADALDLDAAGRAELIAAARPELATAIPSVTGALRLPSIPVPPTALVGREAELASVCALLRGSENVEATRLLTLTGPGGVGKTRLALAAASALADEFADGVAWVELAPLHDPALVATAVVQALGVQEAGDQPPEEALTAALANRRLLLILDNLEHLLPAARLVATLLASAPRLVILATSRARLRLRGEREFPVEPLSVAPVGDEATMASVGAVRLFVERAAEVRPGFALQIDNAAAIAEICRRLDGLPLAIELAAAWSKVLTPAALLSRLERRLPMLSGGHRDLPAHQRTMRDAIAWSIDLLTPDEQAVFRRLSVFAGGFTLEAAEVVAGSTAFENDGPGPANILDLVAALSDQSLLRPIDQAVDDPRFTMLETVREAGIERLEAAGEAAAARLAHAAFLLELVEQAEPELGGPDQAQWLERLEREHANLRDALDWCASPAGGIELGLRMADALWSFWEIRGNLHEGRRWLERMLARAPEPTTLRARVLTGAGALAFDAGDFDAARAAHEEALVIRRKVGDRRGIAVSLGNLGNIADLQGDYSAGRALYEESLAVMRELGQPASVSIVLNNLGQLMLRQGDYAAARAFHEESLATSRELGDAWGIAISLNNLGEVALYQEDYPAARASLEQSVPMLDDLGDPRITAVALNNLGQVLYSQGDQRAARELFEESLSLSREVGDRLGIAASLADLGVVMLDEGNQPAAKAFLAESLSIRSDMGDRLGVARSLVGMAAVARAIGRLERAGRLLGASQAILTAMGAVAAPLDRAVAGRTSAALHDELGPDRLAAARAAGAALTVDQAVSTALDTAGDPG